MSRKHIYSLLITLIVIAAFILIGVSILSTTTPLTREESIVNGFNTTTEYSSIYFVSPYEGVKFPADIAPYRFRWEDSNPNVSSWVLILKLESNSPTLYMSCDTSEWTPDASRWSEIKRRSTSQFAHLVIFGVDKTDTIVSIGKTSFASSMDKVDAPIFYREVNLPFNKAIQDTSKIRWRFGSVKSATQPPVVLEKLPVCGNCHSFSTDGAVLGMDVDYANNKGAYAILETSREMELNNESIIAWSDFRKEDNKSTYGLLSQVSPDGRYVISTVKDRSVFVAVDELAFSQLFFPVQGILVVYDRKKKSYTALKGADDPRFVQSNPTWSPDGKYIVFARAAAVQLDDDTNIHKSALLEAEQCQDFIDRKKTVVFDLYRIPFNDGKGGKAEPLEGASHNGMSNYFAKYSPDGKWIVFCKAKYFMLLQKDSELYIIPASGGVARRMNCNTRQMNSWHSWSPNSKYMVFSAKPNGPYTQLFLTHINSEGRSTPPILLDGFSSKTMAANIPEFVNIGEGAIEKIRTNFLDDHSYYRAGCDSVTSGDIDKAEEYFRKSIKLNPKNNDSHTNLAVILAKQNRTKEAKRHFQKALEIDNSKADAHCNIGNILEKMGDSEGAIKAYKKALEIDKNQIQAHMNSGFIYIKQNKLDIAIEHFQTVIRVAPSNMTAYLQLSRCLYLQGKEKESIEVYRNALKVAPEAPTVLINLARVLAASKNLKLRDGREAVRLAKRACRLTADKAPKAYDVLAAGYAQLGKFELAVRAADIAIQIALSQNKVKVASSINARRKRYMRSEGNPGQ